MNKKLILTILIIVSTTIMSCSTEIEQTTNNTNNFSNETNMIELLQGEYDLDAEKSKLHWYSERIIGSNHQGLVPIKKGQINFDEQKGNFIIDMTKITEEKDNQAFLNHLKSEDFFNTEEYSESIFNLTNIIKEENKYIIKGNLKIKNVTNEINFTTKFSEENNNVVATSQFSIDRTKWEITYDSGTFFQQLGDRAIRDNIDYKLTLYFIK